VPKLAAIMASQSRMGLPMGPFPEELRANLHSIQPDRGIDGAIKRRTDVVGIFPQRRRHRPLGGSAPPNVGA
jgi:hypothetical protein